MRKTEMFKNKHGHSEVKTNCVSVSSLHDDGNVSLFVFYRLLRHLRLALKCSGGS